MGGEDAGEPGAAADMYDVTFALRVDANGEPMGVCGRLNVNVLGELEVEPGDSGLTRRKEWVDALEDGLDKGRLEEESIENGALFMSSLCLCMSSRTSGST